MILRSLELENWRAHRELRLNFERGLNVILGRNEAGKSSLVEALEFALYRDISGANGRLKTEEIRAIIPAHQPNARPRVVVHVEFSNCHASFSKTLVEDAGKRECTLVLRREDRADEHFERGEAQTRWRQLLCADGMGPECGSAGDGTLLVSHQGEGIHFLTEGGAALRSTISVAQNGEITLTRRLEQLRNEVQKARKKELLLDYTPRAVDCARGATEAANARDVWKTAVEERRKFAAFEGEIEELRDQIEAALEAVREIEPVEKAATQKIAELGDLLTRQSDAEHKLAAARLVAKDAGSAREQARTRLETLTRLHGEQERATRELENQSASVVARIAALQTAQNACDDASQECDARAREWENSREIWGAWRAVWDVFEAQTRLNEQKKALQSLQILGAALAEAEAELKRAPRAPSPEEIASWRAAWMHCQNLEREGQANLGVEIEARADLTTRFKVDAEEVSVLKMKPGQKHELHAVSRGVVEITGVGVFKFKTGARGAFELKNELDAAREALRRLLDSWKIEPDACPSAFDFWEARRRDFEAVHARREERARDLKAQEARVGSLHQAQSRVDEAQSELAACKKIALPLEDLIPFRGLTRAQVRQELADAHTREKEAQSIFNRAKNHANTFAQRLREAENELRATQNKPDQIRAAMETRALEIAVLQTGDWNPARAQNQLDELGAAFLRAEIAREEAEMTRRELGDGVSQWKVEEARTAQIEVAKRRADLEKELVRLRTELRHYCDQDPRTKLEELEAKIEILELQLERHESHLRGLAVLDAALESQRLKLSRDLAGPINEKLAPYLSRLRGKETHLEFDKGGTKIESVRTSDGQNTISLPFCQHSEGMKEQVAFALRLILAQKVARALPSQTLPLVLDDPFTQSDAARKAGLGQVLREALPNLQILFVSCHVAPADITANTIFLGDWVEEKPASTRQKTPKIQVTLESEKVVLQPETPATLALF